MGNTIQTYYGARACHASARAGKAKQSGAFLGMAAQETRRRQDILETTGAGTAAVPADLSTDSAARLAGLLRAEGAGAAEAPSLETMLKAKYPNIHYHVFDASSGYWKTRNDYPHYLLYQDGDKAKETLENWEPSGANPFYGSIDGKFTAPKEIHALGNVPPRSKAVVIHPAVQARMEQDPAYAQEIYARIDTWFAFDAARNEAVMPGSTAGMSQAVAIGEDGSICNACSSSAGGGLTFSKSGDEMVQAYRLRMAKRADFMRWLVRQQREDDILADSMAKSAAAKSTLAGLLRGGDLESILGSEIAGVPVKTVLALTQAQVWGGKATL